MQQLEAHEVQLHKVFSGDYDFAIPDYQRPYAWEQEQAKQLLDDLVEAIERSPEEPYFLGSIVLVKNPASPAADVIDGQQRLTTLTILLSVIRDITEDVQLRTDLEKMICEPGSVVMEREPKPRLTLRDRDRQFFADRIQTSGSVPALLLADPSKFDSDAQRTVQRNAKVLHDELSTWDSATVLQLVSMLGKRTFLVVVSTPELESAHRIFGVMNARGLDLSPTDIFKSTVIGPLHESSVADSAEYTEKWETAEETLGRDNFADLFQHIRMIFARERARRELLREFPIQVLDHYLPNHSREFIDDIVIPYADAYVEIKEQSYKAAVGADPVNAWFKRLSQLDNNDWRPPALWAMKHHRDDAEWLAEFMQKLERLASSMFIRRVYATPRAQRYSDLLKQLSMDAGLNAAAFDLTETERAETIARLDGDVYQSTKTVKYVLLRLDEILAADPGVTYSHARVTVEHVLPQMPQAGSEWMESFTKAERDLWTHRLANLVLLNRTKNAQASRADFGEKKKRYFTSKDGVAVFALTTQVLAQDEWSPSVLVARQAMLIEKLTAAWDLAPDEGSTGWHGATAES